MLGKRRTAVRPYKTNSEKGILVFVQHKSLLIIAFLLAQGVFAAQDAVSLRDNTILFGKVVSLDSAAQTIFFEEEIPNKGTEMRALPVRDVLMLRLNGRVYPHHQLPWNYAAENSSRSAAPGADTAEAFLWRYIAVLDLQGANVPAPKLADLPERIREELKERNAFYVVDREEMNGLLRKTALYGLDCIDTSCGREIARALRVPYVILGRVDARDNLYTFRLLLMNARTGVISNTLLLDCLPCNQENVIMSTIRNLAVDISDAATITLTNDEKPAPSTAVPAAVEAPVKRRHHAGLSGALSVVALGLLFAAAAYLFIAN